MSKYQAVIGLKVRQEALPHLSRKPSIYWELRELIIRGVKHELKDIRELANKLKCIIDRH